MENSDYVPNDLITSFREAHPALKSAPDHELLNAISLDHGIDFKGAKETASMVSTRLDFKNAQETLPEGVTKSSGGYTFKAPIGSSYSSGTLAQKTPDAIFLGKQNVPGEEGVSLFNITKEGHPLSGSTVSAKTLVENNLYPEIKSPDVSGMLKSGKSIEEVEQAIQATQEAHQAVSTSLREAMGKLLQGKIGTFAAGAMLPPNLSELVHAAKQKQFNDLGGA